MPRITTNSNPRGDLDLSTPDQLQIPSGKYPTFEVDDSPAPTPPRMDTARESGRVPGKLRYFVDREASSCRSRLLL